MSHGYVPVQWNKNKKRYDAVLWLFILAYIAVFMIVGNSLHGADEKTTSITLMIRALGSLAFLLLTFTLCIGPLARLDTRFLPLLYNRRHIGVSLFSVALLHALIVMWWYHGFGVVNPLESLFNSPGDLSNPLRSLTQTPWDVPFQRFGFFALLFLFILASTSHDFWNVNLGGPLWKGLHMLVYPAYFMLVLHIGFGPVQDSVTGLTPIVLYTSVIVVTALHLLAAFRHSAADVNLSATAIEPAANAIAGKAQARWVEIQDWQSLGEGQGRVIEIANQERIALFRYDGHRFAAVSNVCQHQNGPLGEGCLKDGLITCPWHGYQYRPEDGCSPPPFTEKIPTYELKREDNHLYVNTNALPAGTPRPTLDMSPNLEAVDLGQPGEKKENSDEA